MVASPIFTITEVAAVPAWVTTAIANGWAVGEWLAISGPSPTPGYGLTATNAPIDVATGGSNAVNYRDSALDSWTGTVFAKDLGLHGSFMVGPVGNHFGQGSEFFGSIQVFDVETRTWSELVPPNVSGFTAASNQFGEYNDGEPITNHNASLLDYDPVRQELIIPKGWGSDSSGSDEYAGRYGHALDVGDVIANGYLANHSQWRRLPEMPPEITGVFQQVANGKLRGWYFGQICWDSTRNVILAINAFNSDGQSGFVMTWDGTNWAYYGGHFAVYQDSALAHDPIRDIILIVDGILDNFEAMDPANPAARSGATGNGSSFWNVTVNGLTAGGRASLEWSDALGAFLYSNNSSAVYRLDYVSGDHTNLVLNATNITTGGPTPTSFNTGQFNKFRVADYGSQGIALRQTREADGSCYAMRLN